MSVIRWEEPPPHGNLGRSKPRGSKWDAIADALRSKPGQWGLVVEAGNLGALGAQKYRIERGQGIVAFRPPGAFQARTVKRSENTADLYVRYIGGGAS